MEEMNRWVEAILSEVNIIRESEEPREGEGKSRNMFIVDQSHDQDNRGTIKLANLVNEVCSKLKFNEPFAIQGKPEDELLSKNKHLLPSAYVLISIGTKSGEKFSQEERELIEDYVRNGRNLLLLACPPEKPPNAVLEKFGAWFGEKSIEDGQHHAGRYKDHIIVEKILNHPLNEGVNAIRVGKFGCYPVITHNPDTIVLANSSEDANPPNAPIAVLIPHGAGKVLAIGQSRLIQDDFINELDNLKWLENIVRFIATKQTTGVTPVMQPSVTEAPTVSYCRNCGTKLSEGDIFCGKCGQRITKSF